VRGLAKLAQRFVPKTLLEFETNDGTRLRPRPFGNLGSVEPGRGAE